MQVISATLVTCEFYHRLYTTFTQTTRSNVIDYIDGFQILEHQLPCLYAIAIEISIKVQGYLPTGSTPLRSVRASCKSAFKPFTVEFQPLLDEISKREAALKDLARNATLVEIIGLYIMRSPFLPLKVLN